jgi:hypothetical protein
MVKIRFIQYGLTCQLFFAVLTSVHAQTRLDDIKANSGRIMVTPVEDNTPFTNPFSGWEIWAGKVYCDGNNYSAAYNTTGWGDDCPWFGGVLLDMYWKDIQPEDSLSFDWAYMDSIVNYWYDRGKTFNVRLWCSWDPGWGSPAKSCVPDWAQKGVKGLMSVPEPSAWIPLYSDLTYQSVLWPRIKRFLQEFRKHYAGDKWSGFVQINNMAYGMWGEWWEGEPITGTWGSAANKKKVLDRIIQDWYSVIDTAKYATMCACIECGEEFCNDTTTAQDILGYRYSLPLGAGLSVNGYEGNNRASVGKLRSQLIDKWAPTNPGIGESNWLYKGPETIISNDKYITDFLSEFISSHNDIAHWYAISEDYKLLKSRDSVGVVQGLIAGGIGYRFVITEASWNNSSPGGTMTIKSTWINRNYGKLNATAPIRWFLTDCTGKEYCIGTDSSNNINRKGNYWRKDSVYTMQYNLAIPENIKEGEYNVRIAFINTTTKKIPYIRLAIKGMDAQGRYNLGTVHIGRTSETHLNHMVSAPLESGLPGRFTAKSLILTNE